MNKQKLSDTALTFFQTTQVFKRALDEVYRLKIQAARKVFGQINRIAPTMPFTVRAP